MKCIVGELLLATRCVRRVECRLEKKRTTHSRRLLIREGIITAQQQAKTKKGQQMNRREPPLLYKPSQRRCLSGAWQTCQGLSKWIVGAGKHKYTEIEGHADRGVSGPTVDSLQLIAAKRNLLLIPLCPSRGLRGILKMELPQMIVAFCNFLCLYLPKSISLWVLPCLFFSCEKTYILIKQKKKIA